MTRATSNQTGRAASMGYLLIAYGVALGSACVTGYFFSGLQPIYVVGYADLVATCVIFLFSVGFNNSSFYDPYWSVIPIVIAGYLIAIAEPGVSQLRQLLVFLGVLYWGLRLTHNFLRGWPGIHHEDWRYVDFRKKTGKLYWLVSFAGIHLFPTIMVFLGCLALFPALQSGTEAFGVLDVVATLITFGAVTIELIADNQLSAFRRRPDPKPEAYMKSGLWAYSRHPNYFGEVMFWWGIFLFGLASDPNAWYAVIGPVVMTILFFFISIPMIDKRMVERRPAYREHMKNVSSLIPWFPKK